MLIGNAALGYQAYEVGANNWKWSSLRFRLLALYILLEPAAFFLIAVFFLRKKSNFFCKSFFTALISHSDLIMGETTVSAIKCVFALARTFLFLMYFMIDTTSINNFP
jgi:hypothetical protein